MSIVVGPGCRIRLRFRLELTHGELVDETPDEGATFLYGDGNDTTIQRRCLQANDKQTGATRQNNKHHGRPSDKNIWL